MSFSNRSTNHEISATVQEYIEKYVGMPNMTLAKLIHKDHPGFSVEQVRSVIRGWKGANGTRNRIILSRHPEADKWLSLASIKQELPQPSPFWDSTPYVIPASQRRVLVLADLHIPYHDMDAVACALQYGQTRKIDTVLVLGDLYENHQVSYFERHPKAKTIEKEWEDVVLFWDLVRKMFPKARLIHKEGNHEERFARRVHEDMPEVGTMFDDMPQVKMCYKEKKIEFVGDRRRIEYGYLNLYHGHELGTGRSNPISPARTALLKGREIMAVAHYHTRTEHTVKTAMDRYISCFSIGCLCNLKPRWLPLNDWVNGCAVVERGEGNNFHMDNRTIIKGEVV